MSSKFTLVANLYFAQLKNNHFFFTHIELEDPEAAYEEFEGMPYGDDDEEEEAEDECQEEQCEDKICEKVNEDKLCKKVNEQHEEKVREICLLFQSVTENFAE